MFLEGGALGYAERRRLETEAIASSSIKGVALAAVRQVHDLRHGALGRFFSGTDLVVQSISPFAVENENGSVVPDLLDPNARVLGPDGLTGY